MNQKKRKEIFLDKKKVSKFSFRGAAMEHPFPQKKLVLRIPRRGEAEDEATEKAMAPQEPEGGERGGVKRRKATAATDVSMELGILDCPVCYHPLRPPIFQVHTRTYIEFTLLDISPRVHRRCWNLTVTDIGYNTSPLGG